MFKSKLIIRISMIFAILICVFPNISAAEIKVYDNNNQYLGILLDLSGGSLKVFMPSINASFTIDQSPCLWGDTIYFEENDCSGTPYVNRLFPAVIDIKCQPYDGYYLPDLNSIKQFTAKSMLETLPGVSEGPTCTEITSWPSSLYYGIKPTQLPFTTPISLPVWFENIAGTSDFFVIPVKKK